MAERSAVNRQVLGSIPSGGAYLLLFLVSTNFQKIPRQDGPAGSGTTNPWRNGSASDSRPEGWGFKSLWVQFFFAFPQSCILFPRVQPDGECIASRAPLAERSAVNRQVLGSIPSGGAQIFFPPKTPLLQLFWARGPIGGFRSARLAGALPSATLTVFRRGQYRSN